MSFQATKPRNMPTPLARDQNSRPEGLCQSLTERRHPCAVDEALELAREVLVTLRLFDLQASYNNEQACNHPSDGVL